MSAVSDIYNRLRTAPEHHPASVELFDDMTLQAGDVITVKSDKTSYTVPIYGQDLHWNGSAMTTVESTGNEKREPLSALKRKEYNSNSQSYRYAKGGAARQKKTEEWIQEFENTDLYVNQDSIWAVSGAYTVVTDKDGKKHIQLRDGALLEVQRDGIYETVGTSTAIEEVNNEVVNVIEGSALWTQKDNITGVCGEFSVVTDKDGKKKLKIANGTGLVMTRNNAEFGVYDDGTLTAGVIATKVNGVSSTHITGDNIYIGNDNTVTVINGIKTRVSTLETDYLETDKLSATLSNLTWVTVKSLEVTGTLQFSYSGKNYTTNTLMNSVKALRITPSGNNYTLQAQWHNTGDTWYNVDSSFSRAVTSWTKGWSSGKFSFTANPQNQGDSTTLADDYTTSGNASQCTADGTASSTGKYVKRGITVLYVDGDEHKSTGRTITPVIPASSVYDYGWKQACAKCVVPSTKQTADSVKVEYPSASSIDGVASSVTYKVSADNTNCYIKLSSGTVIAQATHNAYTNGVTDGRKGYTQGTFTKAALTLQGSQETADTYVASSSGTTYYTAASSGVYGRGTKGGSLVCGNAVKFKRHAKSDTPSGTWYEIVSSNEDLTRYVDKSQDWYPGDGGYKNVCSSTSIKVTKVTRYQQGTSYNTTNSPYYTKS